MTTKQQMSRLMNELSEMNRGEDMTTKERLSRLVETLPETDARMVLRVVEGLRATGDPVLRALENAPPDDEPDDDDDDGGLTEAREQVARGEVVSHEEMRKEFGW